MKEKIEEKLKDLHEDLDMYVEELINGHLYTEDYITKRIMETKIQINLLEELIDND